MNRIITTALFLCLLIPAMAQLSVTISGSISNISNGNPIPSHPVTIHSDSSSGFAYYNVVYTNSSGYFTDSFTTGNSYGIINVTVYDCNNVAHTDTCNYASGNTSFTKNFSICHNSPAPCSADFIQVPDSLNSFKFWFFDSSQTSGSAVSYFWDFGDPASGSGNNSTLENPVHEFSSSGTYTVCLTIQSNDSTCYDMTCHTLVVSGGNNCIAQYTYYQDSTSGSGYEVQFLDLSLGSPVSWFWDFGDSVGTSAQQNPTYTYAQPGTYYVCLTIQCQGVTSTWCQTVFVTNNIDCSSYFTYQQNNLQVDFSGYMVNQQPATFAWNFGDGQSGTGASVTHNYANPGMYYVTLTTTTNDSMNCTYSTGQTIQLGDTNIFNQVYGQVFIGGVPLGAGLAMIISVDTGLNLLPFTAISVIDSLGVYVFPYVPEGNFVVLAIPTSSGYLPTYYGDVLLWDEATVISLGDPVNPYNINLLPGQNILSGPGAINGQVNSTGLKSGMTDKIIMILMDMQGNAITFDAVDEAGSFGFGSMPLGNYYLHAELAGVTSDMVRVDLTEAKPTADVTLTFTGDKILGTDETPSPVKAWQIYPNPFRERFSVTLQTTTDTELVLEVFGLSGKVIATIPLNTLAGVTTFTISLPDLHAGLYTVRITTPEGSSYYRKIIRIR